MTLTYVFFEQSLYVYIFLRAPVGFSHSSSRYFDLLINPLLQYAVLLKALVLPEFYPNSIASGTANVLLNNASLLTNPLYLSNYVLLTISNFRLKFNRCGLRVSRLNFVYRVNFYDFIFVTFGAGVHFY